MLPFKMKFKGRQVYLLVVLEIREGVMLGQA